MITPGPTYPARCDRLGLTSAAGPDKVALTPLLRPSVASTSDLGVGMPFRERPTSRETLHPTPILKPDKALDRSGEWQAVNGNAPRLRSRGSEQQAAVGSKWWVFRRSDLVGNFMAGAVSTAQV